MALGLHGMGQVETDTVYLNNNPYHAQEFMVDGQVHLGHAMKNQLKTNPKALHEYHLARVSHSAAVAFSIPTGILIAIFTPEALTWNWGNVTSEGWIALGCLAGAALVTLPVAVIAQDRSDKHLERARTLWNEGIRHKPENHIVVSVGPTRYGAGVMIKF